METNQLHPVEARCNYCDWTVALPDEDPLTAAHALRERLIRHVEDEHPHGKPQQWIDEQRRTIGGSMAAATLGEHEYITPLQAYYALTDGVLPDISDKPDVIRGTLLEPIAAKRLRDTMGISVMRHHQSEFLYNPRYPWAHALPDYWLQDKAVIAEIKVPTPYNWERLDERIPTYIQAQCFHQMAVCDVEAVLLVCLNPVTMEIWRQLYPRDQETIDMLMEQEQAFWETHVVPRAPPAPSSHADIKLLWPQHQPGTSVQASPVILGKHASLLSVQEELKVLEGIADGLKLDIKQFLQENEILTNGNGQTLATWKSQTARIVDVKAMSAENAELVEAYRRESVSRVLRLKEIKECVEH